MSAFDQAEFECLREFYQAWEAFHAIKPGPLTEKERKEAAEVMVAKAHVLRRMRDEKPRVLVPRFAH